MAHHTVAALTAAIGLALATPAFAWGALAVGTTGDVAKDGLAMGFTENMPTEQAAKDDALALCKAEAAKRPDAAAKCEVAQTFQNECYAIAIDKGEGTTGWGWSVKANQYEAKAEALDDCQINSQDGRQPYCEVVASECDTKS